MSSESSVDGSRQPMKVIDMRTNGVTGLDECKVVYNQAGEHQAEWIAVNMMEGAEALIDAYKEGRDVLYVKSIKARCLDQNDVYYLVEWKSGEEATWEPARNLGGAQKLVRAFIAETAAEICDLRLPRVIDVQTPVQLQIRWSNPTPSAVSAPAEPELRTWIAHHAIPTLGKLLQAWMEKNSKDGRCVILAELAKQAYDGGTFLERVDEESNHEFIQELENVESASYVNLIFSEHEVAALKKALVAHPGDWGKISDAVDRLALDCQAYYRKNRLFLSEEENVT